MAPGRQRAFRRDVRMPRKQWPPWTFVGTLQSLSVVVQLFFPHRFAVLAKRPFPHSPIFGPPTADDILAIIRRFRGIVEIGKCSKIMALVPHADVTRTRQLVRRAY